MKREIVNLSSGDDLLDLSTLVNLKTDGTCCIPPSATISTQEIIYSPSNNFSYTTTKIAPAIVCQGLTGLTLNTCLAYVSDANGEPKILAHYGVKQYYGFSPGNAGGACASYGPC